MKNLPKVEKAVSQEEATILKNIQSLIKEILSTSGVSAEQDRTGAPPIEEPRQISEKEAGMGQGQGGNGNDNEGKEEEEVNKDQTNTPSDVATANDDPEDRMMDVLSEVNVENIDEVKKAIAIIKAAKSKMVARKSVDLGPVAKALSDIAIVVKSLVSDQKEMQTAMGNILEGLGVTKQIEQPVQKSGTPIVGEDNAVMAKFLSGIVEAVKKSNGDEQNMVRKGTNTEIALKNVESSLGAIFANVPGKFPQRQ